jgi:hypothetical protein
LSEDEQFRFILSRLYAFARVVTIQFLKCEGKTMDLLADENKRLDVHKYVNLLDKFDRTTAKLLNLLQNSGHQQVKKIHFIEIASKIIQIFLKSIILIRLESNTFLIKQ